MNDRELGQFLNRYFNQTVQLRRGRKTKALNVWEPIVKRILEYVKSRDPRFDFRLLNVGGYYDRTKTKAPNEFDLMLEIPSLSLGHWDPYDEDEDDLSIEAPIGFTTVMIDQGEEETWKRDGCIEKRYLLSATKLKAVFSRLVNDAVRALGFSQIVMVNLHGPAVTLNINYNGWSGSVDLALSIKDASWPDDADEWKQRQRRGWPNQQLVREIVQGGCHLVAKKPKDLRTSDADLFWLYSFSQAEKKLLTEGSSGEAGTCRRSVLRILKSLREDLQLTPLSSYHLKTIMLYEYEAYPNDYQWQSDQLAARYKSALQRLERCLQQRSCPHYFMKSLNLFKHNSFNNDRYQFLINSVNQLLTNPAVFVRA